MGAPHVVGIEGGVGGMMLGAQMAGFIPHASYDTRGVFFQGETFARNFPGVPHTKVNDKNRNVVTKELIRHGGIDLAVCMPSCGSYSNYVTTNYSEKRRASCESITSCLSMLKVLLPKAFILENLPKSLNAFTVFDYMEALPGYRIANTIVRYSDYGVPSQRKRLLVVGVSDEYDFVLKTPKTVEVPLTTRDAFKGLPHDDDIVKLQHVHRDAEYFNPLKAGVEKWLRSHVPDGKEVDRLLTVFRKRPGRYLIEAQSVVKGPWFYGRGVAKWDKPCLGITGGEDVFHPDTLRPLTIRERARSLGFPDTFVFDAAYQVMLKHTGNNIPPPPIAHVAKQLMKVL